MFRHAWVSAALLLSAGCFDHCGPTLDQIEFKATFPGFLSDANRTIARDALREMGFEDSTFWGPGGFFMTRANVTVFVGNESGQEPWATSWSFQQHVERREYGSGDEAHAAGRALASSYWPNFNASLSDFEQRTGWNALRPPTVDTRVVVC